MSRVSKNRGSFSNLCKPVWVPGLEQQKKTLAECALALFNAEDTVKIYARERRELKAFAKKCSAAEQEALERARRLAAKQVNRRRAVQAVVADLTAEEQSARVHAFHLGHHSTTPEAKPDGGTGTAAAPDVYRHYGRSHEEEKDGQLLPMGNRKVMGRVDGEI